MAKIKFNKAKLEGDILRAVESAPLDRIARIVVNSIKKSVRDGISPVTEKPIPPITEASARRRERLAELNRTHPRFSPGKSNLTFTGQLINAITSAVFKSPGEVGISIFTRPTNRRPVIGLRNKPLPSPDNQKIQERIEEGDATIGMEARPYMGISTATNEEVQKILRNHIRRELKKIST